jgi:internalin A
MKFTLRSMAVVATVVCVVVPIGDLASPAARASWLMPHDAVMRAGWWVVDGPGLPPRISAVEIARSDDNDGFAIWKDEKLEALLASSPVHVYMGTNSTVGDVGVANLAAIKNIEMLCLSGPRITDGGLKSLGGLTRLRALSVYGTKATGKGLASLTGLRELQSLELGENESTDSALGSLKQFPKLEKLWLTAGPWGANPTLPQLITRNGLKHLSDAPKLRCLELHGLPIDDLGTREIAALPSLRSLSLERCPLNDDSLTALTSRCTIESLSLDCEATAAEQLRPLAKLTNLKHLTVTNIGNDRRLGKILPEILSCLPNLVELDLSYDWVDDDSMAAIAAMAHLESLRLDWAAITDDGLKQIAGLKNLRLLSLSSCTKIDDKGAECIGKLTSLRDLDLSATGVTDKGVAYLANLTELKRLYLPDKTTDAGLRPLARLKKLEELIWQLSSATTDGLKYLHEHCPALRPDHYTAESKNYVKDGVLHFPEP